ncbi:Hypothetical protein NocV09_00900570 [Nannochloropsis oceanica]
MVKVRTTKTTTSRSAASTISGTRTRPRRRDLKVDSPVPEVPNDDEQDGDGGSGGGKKWVRIYPLGLGKYGDETAVFLGRRKEVRNLEGGRLEALPVPVFASGDLEMLVAAFRGREGEKDGDQNSNKFKQSVLWAGRHLATKDDGLFDNAPWEWVDKGREGGGAEGGKGGGGEGAAAAAAAVARAATAAAEAKKEAYNTFVFGKNLDPSKFSSPYALMLHVVREMVGAVVLELLIDEEDSPRGPGITFGPVVLLQEDPPSSSYPESAPRRKLVDCLLDEVIGLSLAQDRPIKMPLDLYDATVRIARVVGRGKDGILQLEAAEEEGGREGRRRDVVAVMENVKPAWEIASAEVFRNMDTQEKRLCLIKSGAEGIPKRREGPQELDLALLPFLDETVRREARIILAMERGDWKAVAVLEEGKSARGRVKDRLRKAVQEGEDAGVLAMLEEEFIRLTAAKLDPTQDEGSYQRDLDQDDWYLKNRRT